MTLGESTTDARWKEWKWARQPFMRCLDYMSEANQILTLSMDGIAKLPSNLRVAEALDKVRPLMRRRRATAAATANHAMRLERARELSTLAKAEMRNGFPLLHAHTLVAMWGALDALVDDVMVTWLINVPPLLRRRQTINERI